MAKKGKKVVEEVVEESSEEEVSEEESEEEEKAAPASTKKQGAAKAVGKKRKGGDESEEEEEEEEEEGANVVEAKEGKSKEVKRLKGKDAAAFAEQQKAETTAGGGILSDKLFDDLDICEETKQGIRDMEFKSLTLIQSKTVEPLLAGRDLLAQARTGSGKTLAFLIPSIELLHKGHFAQRNGTGVIVLSPTRELSLQTYSVARDALKYHKHTHGIIMGGANRRAEAEKLVKGVNFLIATPGRLLDHLQNTRGFVFRNLQVLTIDEADRILEAGFEDELREILKLLPKEGRQTMLFSATQTSKIGECRSRALIKLCPARISKWLCVLRREVPVHYSEFAL